ncbi:hypothetical protein BsWGS_11280 [Bradybaena similaris]
MYTYVELFTSIYYSGCGEKDDPVGIMMQCRIRKCAFGDYSPEICVCRLQPGKLCLENTIRKHVFEDGNQETCVCRLQVTIRRHVFVGYRLQPGHRLQPGDMCLQATSYNQVNAEI